MKEYNVLFSLGIVVLILGILPLIEKLTLNQLSPVQMAFLRGLAQVMVFGVLIFQGSEWLKLKTVPVSFIGYGLLQGVLIAVMLFFYFHAMQQGEASVVKTLSATSPMLTYALAIFFLNEPFSFERLAGVGLVIGGVYLLIR